MFGTQYWHVLQTTGNSKERKDFLELLSRDLREWILCQTCAKFHCWLPTNGPKLLWRFKFEASCTQFPGSADLAPDAIIKFQDIKQLRGQQDAYIGKQRYPNLLSHTYTSLQKSRYETEISARVVDEELLVRIEYRFFMPLGPDVDHIDKHKLTICRHL